MECGSAARAPAATSSTNTLTASSVPFFLPSCRAQGSTQLSNLYLPRLSFSCTNHAWMLCVCSCVILQLADVGTNGGAAFQRAGEQLCGAAQEVHDVLDNNQEQTLGIVAEMYKRTAACIVAAFTANNAAAAASSRHVFVHRKEQSGRCMYRLLCCTKGEKRRGGVPLAVGVHVASTDSL